MSSIPLQSESLAVWKQKYQLKDHDGTPIDHSIKDTFRRVAKALASVEVTDDWRERWEAQFYQAMCDGAIPAGRILSNAGAGDYKKETSLINCLAGETPVLTRKGLKSIRSLAELETVEVLNGNGNWSTVSFQSHGIQPVYKVHFRYADTKATQIVRATAGHRWIMPSGRVIATEFWLSGGWSKGFATLDNKFVPVFDVDLYQYNQGLVHGVVYGDGSYNAYWKDRFDLTLCAHKMELAPLFTQILGEEPKGPYLLNSEYGTQGLRFVRIESELDLKELPHDEVSNSYLKGFFAGLLATDGSVNGGDRSLYVSISGSKGLMDFLANQLPRIGVIPSALSKIMYKKGENSNYKRNKDVWTIPIHPGTVDPNDVMLSKHQEIFRVTENGLRRSKVWVFDHCEPEYELAEVFCCEEKETQSFCILHGLLTGNCTVSSTIHDSINGIMTGLHEAALSLKVGNGIGYDFSTLRPRGGFIAGAGARTSGSLSFMDIYDKMCFSIASAGGRRGAQMAAMNVSHPDIMDFITAKREEGRFRQFNCSVLITEAFMNAVAHNELWPLAFPMTQHEITMTGVDLNDQTQVIWMEWPIHNDYLVKENRVACRIYKVVEAKELWDTILRSTYEFSEPGIMFIDHINRMNNNQWCEDIRTSNPCGEVPLPPYGSCLLGSINLTQFVVHPFADNAYFDWPKYERTIAVFTRMLDNVVEISGLILEGQRKEIASKRRHGMGYFGLGSAMAMMKIRYGSPASLQFTRQVTKTLALVGWKQALAISKEKGCAPILNGFTRLTPELKQKYPAISDKQWSEWVGDTEWISNKILHARCSHYMQRIGELDPHLIEELCIHGARFTHHTAIAPTGTLALSVGNNSSNGIEPSFSHSYKRNVIKEGKKTKEQVDVNSYEYLSCMNYKTLPPLPFAVKLPHYFVTANELTPEEHIDVQAEAQYWVDQSISKTVNVPSDMSFEEFKGVYEYAYDLGLKGVATFRFNPVVFQGVLVNESDLDKTTYRFVLDTGEVIDAKGNEQIDYDGEIHTAANLYDAINEGYYGKH